MAKLRRSEPLFFRCDDQPLLDVGAVLRGSIELRRSTRLTACVLSTGEEVPVSLEEVRLILEIPADEWVAEDAVDGDANEIAKLVESGLLLRDAGKTEARGHWHPYAALYHFMRRWRDIDVAAALPPGLEQEPEARTLANEGLRLIAQRCGRPPSHFHDRPDAAAVRELPLADRDGELYTLLRARKTTRTFTQEPMTTDELATVLRFTFGCHGAAHVYDDFAVLKKSSPSAGGMHPVEVYPLVVAVDGIDSGLYHYRVADHALELLEKLDRTGAEQLVEQFTAGQSFLRSAQALLVMTARFERSFWRYRDDGAYASLLLDAGHLSQTLYLVCTELGLGAFVTASLNSANIDERLGLDPVAEGAIAACGCGRPGERMLELDYDPHLPPRGSG